MIYILSFVIQDTIFCLFNRELVRFLFWKRQYSSLPASEHPVFLSAIQNPFLSGFFLQNLRFFSFQDSKRNIPADFLKSVLRDPRPFLYIIQKSGFFFNFENYNILSFLLQNILRFLCTIQNSLTTTFLVKLKLR